MEDDKVREVDLTSGPPPLPTTPSTTSEAAVVVSTLSWSKNSSASTEFFLANRGLTFEKIIFIYIEYYKKKQR